MLQPSFLNPGDRIRIVSPAGKIKDEKVLPSVKSLEYEGFEVLIGKHMLASHFQFAGTDQERLQDLQEALDDPKCKAIICSRGGYGAIRIAGQLNFSRYRENPKWLVGFSDITVLHGLFQNQGFCSVHGPMPAYYKKKEHPTESYHQLIRLLRGEIPAYAFESHPLNRTGKAEGELCGGNLSIVYSLLGTNLEVNTEGKVLFIEDLSEYLYHLDRMMQSLKFSGKLKGLKALLVGSFTEMKDNDSPFGQSVEEIILEAVKDYNYPVYFNCPSGHIDENMPLVFGHNYSLNQQDEIVRLKPIPK
ncbi:S66 peptidase family protein [Mangrovibacterium lignilyticum]|uniref:S66 peptidase family protein n=1 Tax=Mangrovibacterium lignilyticum TaxID=2668052 RepID=UPI0013D683E1|nr:LD-carboxypeptidase [Mangrovibacterium lignilyticum]